MTAERNTFRYAIGIISMIAGIAGLIGLYLVEVPTGNRDAVMLALGIVLGWGSTVVSGEWGSSPAGREAAKLGVRTVSDKPIKAEVVNTPANPVPTVDDPDAAGR